MNYPRTEPEPKIKFHLRLQRNGPPGIKTHQRLIIEWILEGVDWIKLAGFYDYGNESLVPQEDTSCSAQ
jgi:hypothetical protein